ncbi:MAG: S1 family peptidase [Steroidobacter sp.]
MCLLGIGAAPIGAATLDASVQSRVRAATFEVVMKKPEQDSLVYERPLPLELLPYTERTDKYVSVGTAFAIGPNRYVTAAHVVRPGFVTQYGQPALRGADGVVHEIGDVVKFGQHQDFIVLTLRNPVSAPVFEANVEPKLDETVFAVGNALGEGIVVRDGLFTSETPEQRDGRWKWIRFSAAASPGNSGGPLLDNSGRVIGVVLQKSANENLNYAVPISLVLQAPEGVARLDGDAAYWSSVIDGAKETKPVEAELKLPLSFPEFARAVIAAEDVHFANLQSELLRKNADTMFPRGEGSTAALHSSYTNDMLSVLRRKENGAWEYFFPETPAVTQLDANGFVASSQMHGVTILKIRRPDTTPVKEFYFDSDAYMKTILKALPWKRPVGREEVRILGMGKARKESQYTDAYRRKWQVRMWNAEYQDMVALSMALPTPDGYLAMVHWVSTSQRDDWLDDLRVFADFSHVAFAGSLKHWSEYLAQKELLPQSFEQIRIEYEYGKSFSYRSQRLELSYSQSEMKIAPESQLRLAFGYFPEGESVAWDVRMVAITENLTADQALFIARHAKPPASMRQEHAAQWQKMIDREFPFNAQVVDNNGMSLMTSVCPYPPPEGAPAPHRVAYQLGYLKMGKQPQGEMQPKFAELFKKIKVLEE